MWVHANTSYTFLELLQIHFVITVVLRMQAFLNITTTMSVRAHCKVLGPDSDPTGLNFLLYSQSHLFLYCLRPALKWAFWVQGDSVDFVCFHVEHPCPVKTASNIAEPLSSLTSLKSFSCLCALWHIVQIPAAPAWSYRSPMCVSEWVAWFSSCLWSCFLESQVE